MQKLNEDQWAQNVACTDENLSINGLYQQASLPSLGRVIFSVIPIHGPTGAIFNIRTKADNSGIEIVRNEVEVFESPRKRTTITSEALQDVIKQYGEDGLKMIARYLRGISNQDENQKTIDFLKNNAVSAGSLTLSNPSIPDSCWREISMKVQDCVLQMNSKNRRTYNAFVVLPYKYGATLMSLFADMANQEFAEIENLFIGSSGLTDWFVNPDNTDENIYVGLMDKQGTGRECAMFSPYTDEITKAYDYETGQNAYFIFNRFAITISPLHTTDNPMIMSFTISN